MFVRMNDIEFVDGLL